MALLDLDDAFLDELRESPADGLELHAQVAADLLARHAQHQFGLREAARMQALHQIEQEGRQSFLGPHAAEQQHDAVVAHDLAAHDLVHMVLQRAEFARERFDPVERHHADLGVFQRHGIAAVMVVDDAIHAEDLARHLETRDLVASIHRGHPGLEEARAHGIERGEAVAVVEQRAAALDTLARADHAIEPAHLVRIQAHGHAELAQVATGTGHFDAVYIHNDVQSIRHSSGQVNARLRRQQGRARQRASHGLILQLT